MPTRLSERYNEAFHDSELLNLRGQFAFLDALITERLEQLGESTSADMWRAAQDAFAEFQALWRRSLKKDGEAIQQLPGAMDALGGILVNGLGRQKAEQDARRLIQEQIAVARQETARCEKMGQMITAQQLMAILASVVAIVRDEERDRSTLARITTRLGQLCVRDAGQGA